MSTLGLTKSTAFLGDRWLPFDEANLSIASAAVLYGLSVYTVFPICVLKNGGLAAFRLPDHYQRLRQSAKIIGLDGFDDQWTFKKFEKVIKGLIKANKIQSDVFVRASLHVDEQLPGTRSRGLSTILSLFVYDADPILPPTGARLKTSVWRRTPDCAIPSRAKVNGAYVNSVLAKQDALDSGYDDCIFLDVNGHVCELSAANIFLIRNGLLITPGVDSDLLEGINRRTVLEVAADLGLKTEQRTVGLTELYVADEVFASGTSALIAPIIEVDARKVGNAKAGQFTLKLQKLHHDILHGANPEYKRWLTKIG